MDELEVLRQRLFAVQREQSAQKLSERNCIEIVAKILELKMVEIIHTINGKEFITPKQLELEIRDELLRSGGRLTVSDLQPLLNVDLSYIQEKVNFIVSRDRSIQMHYGEVYTKYYLDSVVEEIHETLQEVGRLNLNDLAIRFDLNADILSDAIKNRLGRLIIGVFDGDILYTQAHVDRHKARVRGLFTSISKISGIIQGKASQAEFIPTIFSQSRAKWIDSFFSQNTYVPYSTLQKLQIADPASFLKSTYKNGVALSSCFIHQLIVDNVDASIVEVVQSSGWLDISSLVPSPLSTKDMAMIVAQCPSIKDKENAQAIVLNDYFIVSNSFVDRCFALLEKMVQDKVEKQKVAMEHIVTSQTTEKPEGKRQALSSSKEEGSGKGGKGKSSGKGSKQIEEEQDEKPTKSSKANKKGGKGKRRDDSDDDMPAKGAASKKKQVDHLPEIIQILTKSFENMEEELIQSLAQYLRPKVNAIWEKMVKEAQEKLETETMKSRKGTQQELTAIFSSNYMNFLLFKKGMEHLDAESSVLNKHLLKTVGTNLVNLVIEINAQYHMLENTSCDTPAQRTAVLAALPSQLSKSLEKLLQTLSKATINDFIESIETVCDQSQIHLKSLDKKTEKTLLDSHQKELFEQLEQDTDIGNQFQAIVLLMYIQRMKHLVSVPPRSIGTLVQALTKEDVLEEELSATLTNAQQDVVTFIINKSDKKEDEEKLKEKLSILKASLVTSTPSTPSAQ
eukprot:gene14788-17482_t